MQRAQLRDASRSSKFYFRKNVFPPISSRTSSVQSSGAASPVEGANGIPRVKERRLRNCYPPIPPPEEGLPNVAVDEEYEEMTMDEILNGKVSHTGTLHLTPPYLCVFQETGFPGLLGLVELYLGTLDMNEDERCKIGSYLNLIKCRANG